MQKKLLSYIATIALTFFHPTTPSEESTAEQKQKLKELSEGPFEYESPLETLEIASNAIKNMATNIKNDIDENPKLLAIPGTAAAATISKKIYNRASKKKTVAQITPQNTLPMFIKQPKKTTLPPEHPVITVGPHRIAYTPEQTETRKLKIERRTQALRSTRNLKTLGRAGAIAGALGTAGLIGYNLYNKETPAPRVIPQPIITQKIQRPSESSSTLLYTGAATFGALGFYAAHRAGYTKRAWNYLKGLGKRLTNWSQA